MRRRTIGRRYREKPEKSTKKSDLDLRENLIALGVNTLIWFLIIGNLLFTISILFQCFRPKNSDLYVQRVTGSNIKQKQMLIKVEVLNGCGVDKTAATLRDYLVDLNFDVIDFKNYKRWDVPETLIIDRRNMDLRNAKRIADAMGVKKEHVFPLISPQRKLDVSIIIGKDYKQLKAFRQS